MKNITKLLSPTYVKLLNSNNQDLNWQPRTRRAVTDIQTSPNEDNLSIDLEVSSEDIEDGLYLKCLVWYNEEWNMELCTTSSITTTSDTATVHCECRFVSVFLKKSDFFDRKLVIAISRTYMVFFMSCS